MKITLGVYTGEKNVLDKWAACTSKLEITGTLRDSIDFVSPVVTVQQSIRPFFNYAKIDIYNSYYYISNVVNTTRGLSEIYLSRDALQTFAAGIKGSPAIAARASDTHVNADYPDGKYKTLQSNFTSVYPLANLGLSHSIIFGFVK